MARSDGGARWRLRVQKWTWWRKAKPAAISELNRGRTGFASEEKKNTKKLRKTDLGQLWWRLEC